MREKALQAGLYVARIQDEVFELDTPPYKGRYFFTFSSGQDLGDKEGQWTREENRTNMGNMRLIGY